MIKSYVQWTWTLQECQATKLKTKNILSGLRLFILSVFLQNVSLLKAKLDHSWSTVVLNSPDFFDAPLYQNPKSPQTKYLARKHHQPLPGSHPRQPRYNLWTKTKRAGICLSLVCSHIIRIHLSLVCSPVIKILSHQLYSQHSNMFRVTFLTFSGNFVMIPQDSRIKAVIKSRFLYVDVDQPFWWVREDALQPIFCISWKLFKVFFLELYKHSFN